MRCASKLIILVLADLNVARDPDSLTVLEFDSGLLTCTFTGNPAPNITWEREDSVSLPTGTRLSINETSTLLNSLYTVKYFY